MDYHMETGVAWLHGCKNFFGTRILVPAWTSPQQVHICPNYASQIFSRPYNESGTSASPSPARFTGRGRGLLHPSHTSGSIWGSLPFFLRSSCTSGGTDLASRSTFRKGSTPPNFVGEKGWRTPSPSPRNLVCRVLQSLPRPLPVCGLSRLLWRRWQSGAGAPYQSVPAPRPSHRNRRSLCLNPGTAPLLHPPFSSSRTPWSTSPALRLWPAGRHSSWHHPWTHPEVLSDGEALLQGWRGPHLLLAARTPMLHPWLRWLVLPCYLEGANVQRDCL